MIKIIGCLVLLLLSFSANSFEYVDKNGKKREMPEFHHIIDVKLLDFMKPPAIFKLDETGKLQCATCHGIENIMELPDDKIDTRAKNFLHGGRSKRLSKFCYNCHEKEVNTRKTTTRNIHVMLDDQGDVIEEKCKYCHEEVQDRDKAKGITKLKLRLPAEKLCYGCHLKTPHLNSIDHLVELKDKKLAQWKLTQKEKNIHMPLTETGKVMCVTCHTPHEKGVLAENLPAAKQVEEVNLTKGITYVDHPWSKVYAKDKKARLAALNKNNEIPVTLEYRRLQSEVLLRLPAKTGELCLS
ncbi:MAG: hypothetical protein KAG26_06260, partial [Methylococcales bacterium]|nr:hypothetical protein [Methylococcales bacterium]